MTLIFILFSLLAFSQNDVEFFDSKIDSRKGSELLDVIVSGNAPVGTKLKINSATIPILRGEELERFPTKDAIESPAIGEVSDEGDFSFQMSLPKGVAQLPILFSFSDGKRRLVQFSLDIRIDEPKNIVQPKKKIKKKTKKKVKKKKKPKAKRKKRKRKKRRKNRSKRPPSFRAFPYTFQPHLGVGFNFLKHSQRGDLDSTTLRLEFDSYEPAYSIGLRSRLAERWRLDTSYSSASGTVKPDGNIEVANKNYTWDIISVDFIWLLQSRPSSIFGMKTYHGPMFGLQDHSVPYLVRSGISTLKPSTSSIKMLFLGYTLISKIRSMKFEGFMRYQIPVADESKFRVSKSVAFDGSISLTLPITKKFSTGIFWYGQSHIYDYASYDPVSNSNFDGKLNLFFSTMELRGFYSF